MNRSSRIGLAVLGTLLLAGPASAQEPPTRPVRDTLAVADSLVRDTVPAPVDSLPQAPSDTVPPPRFGAILGTPAPTVGANVFSWDRDALLREAAITLGDLLEHVPGMIVLRAGLFQQPEAPTAFGGTRGRLEVVLDGFVLDPLASSSFDFGALELAQLSDVRVERRLDLTRIHLTTLEPLHATAYSRIEAGTGEPSGSVFRGIFTTPRLLTGPFAFAVDRVDGNGSGGQEPADIFTAWAKLGWFPTPERGLQLEYRQGKLRRKLGVPWVAEQSRRDLVLRARNRFFEGFSGELFAGQSSFEQPPADTAAADSAAATLKRTELQYGARAVLRRGTGWLDAELRFRDSEALPQRQLDLGGGFTFKSLLHVAGNLTSASWKGGQSALSYDLRAEVGPLAGLTAFAELSDGERGAPLWADSLGTATVEEPVLESRSGTRFGLTARLLGIEATGAAVRIEADSAAPFGLPFDSAFGRSLAVPAQGLEVFGRIPLWPRGFSVTGSFNYWTEVGGLLYLPARSWRVALELHTLPLPSRNLEIMGRIEQQRREAMFERNPEASGGTGAQAALITMPPRELLNGYLQIRVIDVRAFIHWYDLLGAGREDFPGRVAGGPRIYYGVKWQLFN